MKQYNTFIFDSYSFSPEEGCIELNYSLDDEMKFTETLTVPPVSGVTEPQLQEALFALHIIGGISYYKTCCPKNIEIRSGELTKEQATFWNTVYENGLGEFFYQNKIDFRGLIDFPANSKKVDSPKSEVRSPKSSKVLVPIGGGKDSLVTIELLREAGVDVTLFRMSPHPLISLCTQVSGLPAITIKRLLSPMLFEMNREGALNGHVPITAYLSCVTTVISILYGFDAIAMSNERSASEGNVTFHGKEINHQWSKSLEFERMFQDYIHKYIAPDLDYFSFLRPLSELQIAKLFSDCPQYFECFASCNANWRIMEKKPREPARMNGFIRSDGRWCGRCPKCAFVFCMMAAFLPEETLSPMFNRNLFASEQLIPLFKQLFSLEGCKPFECVGTPEETKAAFLLAHERGDFDSTPVMQMFLKEVMPTIKDPKKLIQDALTPSSDHAMPEEFLSLLSDIK